MDIDRKRLAEQAARPHYAKGRFRNLERTVTHGLGDFLRWQLAPGRRFPRGKRFALLHPEARTLAQPPAEPQLTWLGHAAFLFQYRGLNILTDPVLSERASPFKRVGPKRYTPAALTVAELPEIHQVLISHNHYDHLDETTVRQLHRRFGDDLCFCIPKGLRAWFEKRKIRNLVELDWWHSEKFADGRETFCLPTQHFSGRSPTDGNRSLWCSWLLDIDGFRFYFAGDTGYGTVFTEIGEIFAPIDLALLPIGAYDPRWFMSPVHVDPEEAVHIHRDIGARQSVAMHWGTFVLTDEPMDEPPRRLRQALADQGIDEGAFRVMQHGEIRPFPRTAEKHEPATVASRA
ncbi:MBL fold metallo-hydrolase [Marinobacter nanhaiticus D15-8W]|uniref:MBL fold metallo-hydrolase n=1 Tax=Marinobacter nanhaiticus D15-8W TaxID=626887 RepID=N6WVT1_9GAMM|nr:MBL fold metallo-hydrolase [Marinobacter nanhaiticus]ENO12958.1 MBL fold metallo-hydrolase [Marinobacter nanhaiticus D15-8W]BES70309.1 MBL fold metallo-hydrolase [Marinobacter nanhaiticus D15-8W]